jgi:hypothetical protein
LLGAYLLQPNRILARVGPTRADQWAATPVLVCFIAAWVIFLWACGRGFDFGDDSLGLFWAEQAPSFKMTTTEFANVWHPLYLLAGHSIASYQCLSGNLLNRLSQM